MHRCRLASVLMLVTAACGSPPSTRRPQPAGSATATSPVASASPPPPEPSPLTPWQRLTDVRVRAAEGRRVWLDASAVDDRLPHVVEIELPHGAPAAQTEPRFVRAMPGRLISLDRPPPRRGTSIVLARAKGRGLWLYRDAGGKPVPLDGDGAQFDAARLLTWGKSFNVYEADTGQLSFVVPFRGDTSAGDATSLVQDNVWFQFLAPEPCRRQARWVRAIDLTQRRVVFEEPEAAGTVLGPKRELLAALLPDGKGGFGGVVALWRLTRQGDATTLVKLGVMPIQPGLHEAPDLQLDAHGRKLNVIRCVTPGELDGDRIVQVVDVPSLRMRAANRSLGRTSYPSYMAEVHLKPTGKVPIEGRELIGAGVPSVGRYMPEVAFAASDDGGTWAMVTGKRVVTSAGPPTYGAPAYVDADLVVVDAKTRHITIRRRLPATDGPDGLIALRLSGDGRWAHLVRKTGGPLLFDTEAKAFVELDPKSAGGELKKTHFLSNYEIVELDTGRRWRMPFARR